MTDLFKELGDLYCPKKNEAIIKDLMNEFGAICLDYKAKKLASTFEGYDTDEDGNMISCCGDILDPVVMRCNSCGENC